MIDHGQEMLAHIENAARMYEIAQNRVQELRDIIQAEARSGRLSFGASLATQLGTRQRDDRRYKDAMGDQKWFMARATMHGIAELVERGRATNDVLLTISEMLNTISTQLALQGTPEPTK